MAKGKKAKAFKLFDKEKTPSSPEVKALGLKGSTRYTYHDEWKKSKAEGGEPETGVTKTPNGESVGGYDETNGVKTSGGESIEGYDETGVKEQGGEKEHKEEEKVVAGEELGEKKKPEVKPEVGRGEEKAKPPMEQVPVPEEVVGFGIRIGVFLSLKTLSLYQIASTTAIQDNGHLSLGGFIDQCVEDFFIGRGSDLMLGVLEEKED